LRVKVKVEVEVKVKIGTEGQGRVASTLTSTLKRYAYWAEMSSEYEGMVPKKPYTLM